MRYYTWYVHISDAACFHSPMLFPWSCIHAGMRVRMGIATGNLLFGASPAGSAVMDLAKSEHRQE